MASASDVQHLTQRKGIDGLETYGWGHWSDWRFSTVGWLQQEHKEFEALLQIIGRMTKGPEEPEGGSAMEIGGAAHADTTVVLR